LKEWELARRAAAKERAHKQRAEFADKLRSMPRRFDNRLRRNIGPDNDIIYRFAQIMLYGMIPVAAVAGILWALLR